MPIRPLARVPGRSRPAARWPVLSILSILLVACGAPSAGAPGSASPAGPPSTPAAAVAPPTAAPSSAAPPAASASGSITLYTSVQQPVVDAVLGAFATAQPDVKVNLFRAATGELSARIATEHRAGQVQGDVLWLTDPLSMQGWASQGVLQAWTPVNAAALDAANRSDTFWGTRILNMVIVRGADVTPGPADWADLADAAYKDAVAMPDPAFAGSAFATLGYLALQPGYGMDFYQRLKANGAVQVKAPDDVTTGVAEGRYKAGITLDSSARAAAAKGSPVVLVWPSSGSISMYGPVAVVDGSPNAAAAQAFVEFLLSPEGQRVLGKAGQEPMLPDSGGPAPGGREAHPDWPAVFGQQEQLLEQYRGIFGG